MAASAFGTAVKRSPNTRSLRSGFPGYVPKLLCRSPVCVPLKLRQRVMQNTYQSDLKENTGGRANCSDRILRSAGILGVQPSDLSLRRFRYIELFDLQIQRRPWNSEFQSGSVRPGNFSVALHESSFDEFFLVIPDVLCKGT